MKPEPPVCRACARLARPGHEGFCSEACRQAFVHDHEREPERETVQLQDDFRDGRVWSGGRRLNLQNSA